MTKKIIDYSKTIFYKIICNDVNIKDCYIGHTTNFSKRKTHHKSTCNNETNKHYNCKVYKFIRDNGGWENWTMNIVGELNCEKKQDAEKQERKFIEEYGSTLNQIITTRTQKEYQEINKDKIKQYREDNKDKYKELYSNWYINNKEKKKEQQKIYRELNRVKLNQKKKEYRDKQKLKEI